MIIQSTALCSKAGRMKKPTARLGYLGEGARYMLAQEKRAWREAEAFFTRGDGGEKRYWSHRRILFVNFLTTLLKNRNRCIEKSQYHLFNTILMSTLQVGIFTTTGTCSNNVENYQLLPGTP